MGCEKFHKAGNQFRKQDRKNYSIEEYYNVVILDYVMACQMYLEREGLKEKYNFPIIAYMRMNSAVSNYFKANNCQCRKVEHGEVSLEQLSDPGRRCTTH